MQTGHHEDEKLPDLLLVEEDLRDQAFLTGEYLLEQETNQLWVQHRYLSHKA